MKRPFKDENYSCETFNGVGSQQKREQERKGSLEITTQEIERRSGQD